MCSGSASSLRAVALVGAALVLGACGSDEPVRPDSEPPPVDVLLEPPADGWQYQVPAFQVAQGAEVQHCFFFEVPYDDAVFVDKITVAQNTGTHHMNVLRVKTIDKLDGEPGDAVKDGECWVSSNWKDWPIVANSQRAGIEEWALPEGVGLRFEGHEKLMLQTHWVNATTQTTPFDAKVFVNFERAKGADLEELGTVFATNQGISVCPGQVHQRFEASCRLAKTAAVTIVAASGHFHSRGDRFTISGFDPAVGAGDQFYESTSWNDPPFTRGLDVNLPKGHGFSWSCEFSAAVGDCGDPNKGCCFTFGGHVETQEHCNAFVYFYPRGATDLNCF